MLPQMLWLARLSQIGFSVGASSGNGACSACFSPETTVRSTPLFAAGGRMPDFIDDLRAAGFTDTQILELIRVQRTGWREAKRNYRENVRRRPRTSEDNIENISKNNVHVHNIPWTVWTMWTPSL